MLMLEKGYAIPSNKLALIYNKNSLAEDVLKAKIDLMNKGFEVATFEFPKNFNNFAEKLKLNNYKKIVKINDLNKFIDL